MTLPYIYIYTVAMFMIHPKPVMELSVVIVLLFSLVSPATSSYSLPVIKPWCAQTLYPELCEYFFTHNPKYGNNSIHNKSDFLKMSLQLVLDRAINATENAQNLGSKCRDNREKAAWVDCVNFYSKTIIVLNQTIDPKKCTPSNIQTCLSTTLTNLDTCKQGFMDFGITDNVMPLIVDIVLEKLTINALALNSGPGACGESTSYQHGFPTWVTPSDRRLLQSSNPEFWANIVVAQDGSGDYTTVKEAINAASQRPGNERFVIHVKAGIYKEYIIIESSNIALIGDGIGRTIITGNRHNENNFTTTTSATVAVTGDRFMARKITFRNEAGADKGQAVAFLSDSEFSVLYRCSFEGYQDTLYVRDRKQFFRTCDIYGTVDFIMGDATVVFQKCTIYARRPPYNVNTITAQSRNHFLKCSGMSFHNCKVKATPELKPIENSVRTYLGRPWRAYARVVFLKSYLDSLIDPEGWLDWNTTLDTLYYGEYHNSGPGSSTAKRVQWPGYHIITDYNEASRFSVRKFIDGGSWLSETKTPFNLDI